MHYAKLRRSSPEVAPRESARMKGETIRKSFQENCLPTSSRKKSKKLDIFLIRGP
jgi:hypothetical protein